MNGFTYQKMAMRTSAFNGNQKEDMAAHAVYTLCSEAGEVAGIFQKFYQGYPIDIEHIKKELGDCMWAIAEVCAAFDLDLDDVMQTNIDKLHVRYPNGFEVERSLHRQEGDI